MQALGSWHPAVTEVYRKKLWPMSFRIHALIILVLVAGMRVRAVGTRVECLIVLQQPVETFSCFDMFTMNGKLSTISAPLPVRAELSKAEVQFSTVWQGLTIVSGNPSTAFINAT
jgi:hypothetical protein